MTIIQGGAHVDMQPQKISLQGYGYYSSILTHEVLLNDGLQDINLNL